MSLIWVCETVGEQSANQLPTETVKHTGMEGGLALFEESPARPGTVSLECAHRQYTCGVWTFQTVYGKIDVRRLWIRSAARIELDSFSIEGRARREETSS